MTMMIKKQKTKKMGKERKEKSIQQKRGAHLCKCIVIKISYNSPILCCFSSWYFYESL